MSDIRLAMVMRNDRDDRLLLRPNVPVIYGGDRVATKLLVPDRQSVRAHGLHDGLIVVVEGVAGDSLPNDSNRGVLFLDVRPLCREEVSLDLAEHLSAGAHTGVGMRLSVKASIEQLDIHRRSIAVVPRPTLECLASVGRRNSPLRYSKLEGEPGPAVGLRLVKSLPAFGSDPALARLRCVPQWEVQEAFVRIRLGFRLERRGGEFQKAKLMVRPGSGTEAALLLFLDFNEHRVIAFAEELYKKPAVLDYSA